MQQYLGKKKIQAPSKNVHRIIEQPRLEETSKDHLQPFVGKEA